MALQKNQVPISFNGGIDSKSDDKQVMATKLLELENGIFTKKGAIQKRNGYTLLPTDILGSAENIVEAYGLANFKSELNLFTGTELYTYIEGVESWQLKGNATSLEVSNQSIIRNVYQQSSVDYAYNNGLGIYTWADSSGGVRYTLIDESTGSIITENQSLSSTGIKPRVVGIGVYLYIYYIEGNALRFRFIQVSAPKVLSSAVSLTNNIDPVDKIYDVQRLGSNVYVAYNNNTTGGGLSYFLMTESKVMSTHVQSAGETATGGISLATDSADNIWISYFNGSEVKYLIRDSLLSTLVLSPTVVDTLPNVRNIASVIDGTTTGHLVYEVIGANGNYLKKATVSLTGSVSNVTAWKRSVGLASKFFTYNESHYVAVAFDSTLQSTYFIYSLDGDIVTKVSQNLGGGYTDESILPTIVEVASGRYKFPNLRKGQLQAEDSVLFTSVGVNSTTLDFESLNNFVTAELAENLHMVGGLFQSYDGASITESGFAVFPEGVTATLVSPGTGNLANGDYQFSVVYAWIDNNGQINRSAPSIPTQVTVSGGPSNVQLTIPTLRITKKQNVFIEVYRTEVNQTLFYKTTSNTSLTLNNPDVDTLTYTDSRTDVSLLSGELLYTTGGVLDNISPPPSSVVVNWKNRLVIKSSDEPNLLWYSKIRNENGPVEFSDFLRINVDPKGGDITALGVLDDKLVIFKESSIHMLAGDGPNNLGEQSDFPLPQLVIGDAGCIDTNSIVTMPKGLMFKSQKGIYLLDRGLSVSYVGAEVERYNSSRITAARLISDVNQIRFTTEDDLCLVYDYLFEQWSTFTNHEAVGAAELHGAFAFAKSNGIVYVETPNHFVDGEQPIKLKIVSAWMNMAEISGFQRFYKLLLLGTYKSKHRLRLKVGYDFNATFIQDSTIDPFTVLGLNAYGDVSPYGAEEVYGGENPLYMWRFFPKRQKCTSFRISIEDIMDDVFGESFSISNMRMEIGLKQGSNKLGSSRSYGTT